MGLREDFISNPALHHHDDLFQLLEYLSAFFASPFNVFADSLNGLAAGQGKKYK
jgi:hypothetical protein